MRFRLLYTLVAVAILGRESDTSAAGPNEKSPPFTSEQITYFEKNVRPLLAAKCVECHGPDLQEAGLRLDSRGGVLHGMEGSPAAVPGDPGKSRLIAVVKYDGDVQMPPDGKLDDEQLAVLTNWVKLGLPWSEETASPPKSSDAKPNVAAHEKTPWGGSMDERIVRARAEHWAFQPVKRAEPPQIGDPSWNKNPVDRFVAAKLAAAKLQPASEADPATLIRRVYFDLIGLPPNAGVVEAFVRNYSPEIYAALVDELLSSPRYGERWARH